MPNKPGLLTEAERQSIAGFIVRLDDWGHEIKDARSDNELCLAADVVHGWGPDAADWETAKTPALEALHKLLWGAE